MVSSMRAVRTGSLEGRPCANRCAMDVSADATAPGVVADMSYQKNKWESASAEALTRWGERAETRVRARARARRCCCALRVMFVHRSKCDTSF